MKRYDPRNLEPKWQKIWDETNIYTANLKSDKPKYIAMSMFNYPSGAGIHIGHAMNYTISDVKARFKRQQGYESYHPVGWDAFGLPAENYAIKAGVSPQESMATIIPDYHKQYKAMGWSNDWEKEISTHTPEYYKWTQWIFSQMHKNKLAYQDIRLQWWCDKCQTVLANEQVIDGKCWRHDAADDPIVEKREVKQWFFKITEYAEELLNAIDELDWSESVKLAQKNWIGKSAGAEINFKVKNSKETITVFTTRPDTLFGATFMVVAPESDILPKLVSPGQKSEVDKYVKAAAQKTEVERQAAKTKTGVFTGSFAINPATKEEIPIWVADYVLAGYGTGAIMAVPAHDERDFEFAQKFNLLVRHVIDPVAVREDAKAKKTDLKKKKIVAVVTNDKGELLTINWGPKLGGRLFIGGTVEGNESPETTALREVTEETGYVDLEVNNVGDETFHYKYYAFSKEETHEIETKFVSLQLKSNKQQDQQLDESEKGNFKVEWVTQDVAEREIVEPLHRYGFEKFILGVCYTGEGLMVNSGDYDGLSSNEAREKIIGDLTAAIGDETVDVEYTSTGEPVFIQKTEVSAVKKDQPFVEREAITAIVKHWKEDKYIGLKWKKVDWDTLITGGIESGQTAEEAAIEEIREETGYLNPKFVKDFGKMHAKFFHVPKKENRHAHFDCLYFELADDEQEAISQEEQQNHDVVWLSQEEMKQFRLPASHRYVWDKLLGQEVAGARPVVNYRMRDWSVSRQRYWGAPIPIINCSNCGPVLVPDEGLPVVLPELTDFKPSGDGRSALARAKDWLKVPCPQCGGDGERETDTLDTYIDSSWYMFRYFDPQNQAEIFDSEVVKKWEPIDFYNGADHATAHLLYARFMARFFTKLGLINQPEPFKQFLFNGKVTASDGQMFSKSKGNGVDPLEIIGSGYGADALRMYLMFAAPLEVWARWDPQGVPGTHRFLSRLWTLVQEYLASPEISDSSQETDLMPITHRMIRKMTEDIEENRYNTAIAASMEALNALYKLKAVELKRSPAWQTALEHMVACIAPFAPHIADELWLQLGHSNTVHIDSWPQWDNKYLEVSTITIVVQINGKVRANIDVNADTSEEDIKQAAHDDPKVAGYLKQKPVKKVIYVPGRLVNFVV